MQVQIDDLDDFLLWNFYTNLVGIPYVKVLNSKFFNHDKEACNQFFKECVEEEFLYQIDTDVDKNHHLKIYYGYCDPQLALKRCDQYLASGKWKFFDDMGLGKINLNEQPRNQPLEKYLLLRGLTRKFLSLNDINEYYSQGSITTGRRRIFLISIGHLLRRGLLTLAKGRIVLSSKGVGETKEIMKQPNWTFRLYGNF